MNFVPPDTCLKDYKKRRSAFLKELIASTPNVSARAKEFRRWIDENSPYSDIKAERDRKWRFALADIGITVECFLDEK